MLEHLLVTVLGISLYPYLNLIGFDEIAKGFVIFFVASYGISVIENLAAIGVPIPKWVRTRLEKIEMLLMMIVMVVVNSEKNLLSCLLKNTSSIREIEDSYSEVYSHDRNNGNFEFKVEDELLTDERVVALFKFLKSKKVWKTEGLIEEGVIKVKFDNTLITRDEPVVCYLYLDGSEVDSDVFKFKFDVKLSEIDKVKDLPEKERYFKNSIVVDRVDVLTRDVLVKKLRHLRSHL